MQISYADMQLNGSVAEFHRTSKFKLYNDHARGPLVHISEIEHAGHTECSASSETCPAY